MNAHQYLEQHQARFLDQLIALLRIPSVSTDPNHAADVRATAVWLAEDMQRIGLANVQLFDTPRHPIVYGEDLRAGPAAPTVLVYGHYDVQPADQVKDNWDSHPFEPVVKEGRVIARGATDDKGQAFAHLKAYEALNAHGAPKINLKFLIEGEEEIGSPNLVPFVKQHHALLRADVCVISDTSILSPTQPSVVYALRGLTYMEIEVFGPAEDLHSGVFGGTVHNPAQALAEILAALHHADGSIAVDGFYDDVLLLDEEERAEQRKADWPLDDWQKSSKAPMPWGEAQYTLRERVGARPTLEVNGFVSGFYGEGSKTVLPSKALAKVSCRLVANQDPYRIYELVKAQVARITPPTVRSEVRLLNTGHPALTERDTPLMQVAIRAYEQAFGARPVFVREGGSIPIVADFRRELGTPVILMGFGLNDDGAHGPNEKFELDLFHKAMHTALYFYEGF
jgi:acetylornithine deacetylase/succinyl-diaminopimelate desuccinylase-like protein